MSDPLKKIITGQIEEHVRNILQAELIEDFITPEYLETLIEKVANGVTDKIGEDLEEYMRECYKKEVFKEIKKRSNSQRWHLGYDVGILAGLLIGCYYFWTW